MAIFVVTAARVEINSVDESAYGVKASLKLESDAKGTTAFGATWEAFIAGLKKGTLELSFNQDFAASTLDARMWAIFNAGTNVTFKLRPTNAAIGTSNPEYSGSVTPVEYTPLDASVGDLATLSFSWPTSGTVNRATA